MAEPVDVSWHSKDLTERIYALERGKLTDLEKLFMTEMAGLRTELHAMDRLWSDLAKLQESAVIALGIANQKAIDSAFVAASQATKKAEDYNDEWKRNSNEWKSRFDTVTAANVTRSELVQIIKTIDDKIDAISRSIEPVKAMGDIRRGRDDAVSSRMIVEALEIQKQNSSYGSNQNWITVMAVLVAIGSLIMTFFRH